MWNPIKNYRENKRIKEETLEQLKILNMLYFLDSQYQHTDSILPITEIQQQYNTVGKKLFDGYQFEE